MSNELIDDLAQADDHLGRHINIALTSLAKRSDVKSAVVLAIGKDGRQYGLFFLDQPENAEDFDALRALASDLKRSGQ